MCYKQPTLHCAALVSSRDQINVHYYVKMMQSNVEQIHADNQCGFKLGNIKEKSCRPTILKVIFFAYFLKKSFFHYILGRHELNYLKFSGHIDYVPGHILM